MPTYILDFLEVKIKCGGKIAKKKVTLHKWKGSISTKELYLVFDQAGGGEKS